MYRRRRTNAASINCYYNGNTRVKNNNTGLASYRINLQRRMKRFEVVVRNAQPSRSINEGHAHVVRTIGRVACVASNSSKRRRRTAKKDNTSWYNMTSWSIGRNLKVLKDRRVRGDQSSPTARLEKERFEGWVGLAKRRDRTMEREGYNWL